MTANHKIGKMVVWAALGLLFIINSFVSTKLIDDGGFVSSVSALIAVIVLVVPMIGTVISDLKMGKMRMHELAVLAVFASCLQGDFRTSACIAFFILISMIIETRTASGAQTSLEALTRLSPGKAHRLGADGSEEDIESHQLKEGDMIRVRPGENIMVDGVITKGRSSINESNITGESLPVDKVSDNQVFAGTTNLTGILDVKVTKAGDDTTLGKVRELIMKAQASKLPFVRLIDEYVKYYTPLILTIAATVLYFNRFKEDGLDRVVAMLVVTCPIALILATPAAIVAALSASARLGVLFKDVNDIEALARINAFVFDKTGTLTTGVLEVSRLTPTGGVESADLLKAAALAELGSNHPVAKAIRTLAKEVNMTIDDPDELHEEPGRGVRIKKDEDEIIAGNLAWMTENGIEKEQFDQLEQAEESGMSLLFVVKNGKPLGWIGLSDKPRSEAEKSIQDLDSLDVKFLAMVSGDRQAVVKNVGSSLRIPNTKAGCSPADKVTYLSEVKNNGYNVVFVGDGVNDGPALANSHIGIAMGAAGSDVALESAQVALMNNELNRIPFLLRLARKMKMTIVQNFFAGSVVIAGGIILSSMGKLSPVIAAVLQVVGALSVALNSAKLIRQGENLA